MKCCVVQMLLLAAVGLAAGAPQRRPVKQQTQEPQFIKRFNPEDEKSSQNFAPVRQQQQKQDPQPSQRFTQQQQDSQPSQRFTQQQQQDPQPIQRFSQQQQDTQPRFTQQTNQRETTTFIPIIRQDNHHTIQGGYETLWETGNNILAQETGVLKSFGSGDNKADAVVQQGSYSYTSPEGQLITVHYTADERGFRATGDHIPTPPPIPADIQKGLDAIYAGIASQQSSGSSGRLEDGQYNHQEDQNQPQFQSQQPIRAQPVNFRPQSKFQG